LTQPEEIFFDPKGKIEKFDVFRGNFPNSNPNHKWLTEPGSKKFFLDPLLGRDDKPLASQCYAWVIRPAGLGLEG